MKRGKNNMAKEDNLIKAVGIYNGHSIKKNFDIELKFRFIEEQLANSLQFVACIGKQVKLKAKIRKEKLNLGVFNVNKITVDKNGNAYISLMSNSDYVSLESIEKLLVEDEEVHLAGMITEIIGSEEEE